MSRFVNNQYQTPESLSFNSPQFNDIDPIIAADESFILFVSNNRKGYGSSDLWISFRDKENWSEPLNLGPKVNSFRSESTPGISPDNKKLYFSAFREKIDRSALLQPKNQLKSIDELLHSYKNGLSNIYEISILDLLEANKKK